MTGESHPHAANRSLGHEPTARGVPAQVAALVRDLDQLRVMLHERLDQAEALLRRRASERPPHALKTEAALQNRVAELESGLRQALTEIDRLQGERQALFDQVEHDKKVLTEAWERLEREQAEGGHSGEHNGVSSKVVFSVTPPAHEPPPPTSSWASDDPVAQEILRQFQTLRRDVRRNSHREAR